MKQADIEKLVKAALKEDIGTGDITAKIIPPSRDGRAIVISREEAVVCGQQFVDAAFHSVDPTIKIEWQLKDGDLVAPNQIIFTASGNARKLLTAERTALNFLQLLSGTATATHRYVEKLKGTPTQLLDTRKTIPGLRLAQKYAVKVGGGKNHRLGLYDAVLIKENHISACQGVRLAIQKARKVAGKKKIEIEVENLFQLEEALQENPDIIMLDNFDLPGIRSALLLRQEMKKTIPFEVSGNINLDNIRVFAETGVDFISVGAITKHVRAVDLSMRLKLIHPSSGSATFSHKGRRVP